MMGASRESMMVGVGVLLFLQGVVAGAVGAALVLLVHRIWRSGT